ncbi:microfibril-associated glycoprotein 4-like [Branchiostoma lanceolatum]|uniref:microfibril-associated glycoprotein 4-like n=1 Tax=Branchiostoma lanceolatum TaxID=7740 RepID=UPI00345445E2
MWFLHVFVVLTVLQWSVVTGEGHTDQFTLSLCRVWAECVRTAAVDNVAHADLGTPHAICGDFAEMLEKHGVDCETMQDPEEKTSDVELIPVSLEPHQDNVEQQEPLPPAEDEKGEDDGDLDYKPHLSGNLNSPANSKKLGRTNYFDDCSEIHTAYATLIGHVPSGVHSIKPVNVNDPISVYCDQTTDGGGWTVIQRRFDGSLEFYRWLEAYRYGFGDSSGEYWLGLDKIHRLTSHNAYELYIELEDWDGNVKFARYSSFSVGPGSYYTLGIGGYSGTAGDGFGLDQPTTSAYYLNGAKFSTRYFDQDMNSLSMADYHGGGWWYGRGRTLSSLNGPYFRDTDLHSANNGYGVLWHRFTNGWYYSLKKTKMMVRPTDFSTRMIDRKLTRQ